MERKTYSISHYWNRMLFMPKKYRQKLRIDISKCDMIYLKFMSVILLLDMVFVKGDKKDRLYFWRDNVGVTYYKLIGCKIGGHKWYYYDDEERGVCLRCNKLTGYIPRKMWYRMVKLKKIKKK